VALIVFLATVNVRGTRKSATVQNWTTGFKVAALVMLAGALIALRRPPTEVAAPLVTPSTSLLAGLEATYRWIYDQMASRYAR